MDNNVIKADFKNKHKQYKTPWGMGDVVIVLGIITLLIVAVYFRKP